jgi:hypothetical protein
MPMSLKPSKSVDMIRGHSIDKMREAPAAPLYPHERRLLALFAASLRQPVPPAVVGEQIRHIIESAGVAWWPVGRGVGRLPRDAR